MGRIMFCAYLRFETQFLFVCLNYSVRTFVCQWAKSGLVANRYTPVAIQRKRGYKMEGNQQLKKCKYCQSEIDKKAKVCPVCKRTLKSHGCLWAILFFLLAMGASIAVFSQLTQPTDDKYITLTEFNKIETGMTYEEVTEIVGSSGTITSKSSIAGHETVIVTWYANPNIGTNANVTFQDGKVIAKAQVGLQ